MSEQETTASELLDHAGVNSVRSTLIGLGATRAAAGILVLDSAAHTAAQAAEALGIPVGAIANSLLFLADDAPLLVMTSGAHRADPSRLADLIGASIVRKADPQSVRRYTGQVIGGVSPVGHPASITTLVDMALADYEAVWAAAGHPRTVFPTTFSELVTITNGIPAIVAAELQEKA